MPTRPVTVRRWQVVASFVALAVAFSLGLWKVQHDSASIAQLEKTNCSLKQFLLTAEQARERAAAAEKGLKKRHDEEAALGYATLAGRFTAVGGHCNVPVDRRGTTGTSP